MDDGLKETGRCAYAAIDEMVTALNVDYDRLMKLRKERQALLDMTADAESDEKADARAELAQWDEENGDELEELKADAGDCEDREDAERRIHEDALSIEVRTGWYSMGELDDNREPARAWLEVQDWGTPWARYYDASQAVLLAYARCFYFGE